MAVTEARLLLAEGDAGAAVDVLTPAHPPAVYSVDGRRARSCTLAIAHDETGDTAPRRGRSRSALDDCRAHRPPLAVHRGGASDGDAAARARSARAPRTARSSASCSPRSRTALPARRPVTPLLEPLSEREQAILRYLPTTLSNREIAAELFVTTNTVKTHLRSIYRKLDVARRREAVERARDLRLLQLPVLGASANPPSPSGSGSQ